MEDLLWPAGYYSSRELKNQACGVGLVRLLSAVAAVGQHESYVTRCGRGRVEREDAKEIAELRPFRLTGTLRCHRESCLR